MNSKIFGLGLALALGLGLSLKIFAGSHSLGIVSDQHGLITNFVQHRNLKRIGYLTFEFINFLLGLGLRLGLGLGLKLKNFAGSHSLGIVSDQHGLRTNFVQHFNLKRIGYLTFEFKNFRLGLGLGLGLKLKNLCRFTQPRDRLGSTWTKNKFCSALQS